MRFCSMLFVFLVLISCGRSGIDLPDAQSSPQKVVEGFIRLYQKNPVSALQLVHPKVQKKRRFERNWTRWTQMMKITGFGIRGTSHNNTKVKAFVRSAAEPSDEIHEAELDFGVKKVDGLWWVWNLPF